VLGSTALDTLQIFKVPSSPIELEASDNGVWLLTPPSASTSGPTAAPEPGLFIPLGLGLASLTAAWCAKRRESAR
jgi:hypothetical protein